MGTGSVGRVVASAGTPGAAAEEVGVANTTSTPSKKPPMGAPWRQKAPRPWGGIWKEARAYPKRRKEKDMKIKGTFKQMSQTKVCGK